MIELSHDAADLIRRLRREHGASDKAVMRVVVGPGRGFENLQVSFAACPGLGEDTGRRLGITISLPPGLSRALDGRTMHVLRTATGDKLILHLAPTGGSAAHPEAAADAEHPPVLLTAAG
jgi:hypothetical protein